MALGGDLTTLLNPLFSGGVHPTLNRSDSIVYPYCTYFSVAGSDVTIHQSPIKRKRMQIDVFAESYGSAQSLGEQVQSALNGSTIVHSLINEGDAFEETQGVYRLILEFYMWV